MCDFWACKQERPGTCCYTQSVAHNKICDYATVPELCLRSIIWDSLGMVGSSDVGECLALEGLCEDWAGIRDSDSSGHAPLEILLSILTSC